jgi:probable HAF family extracellular repeat protein
MVTVNLVNKFAAMAACALLCSSFGFSQVAFTVVKVPSSSPNTAIAVNNSGRAVVNTATPSSNQVSIWSSTGGAQTIGLVGTNVAATDINDSGAVTGTGDPDSSTNQQAFYWQSNGGTQWLGSLGGNFSEGFGVSNNGSVVGFSFTGTYAQHAFLWTNSGGMQDLTPDLTSLGGATARSVNSSNQVVGYYYPNGARNTLGFSWTPAGGFTAIGTTGTLAFDVNEAGTVVGQYPAANGYKHAFSWTQAGGIKDLGSLGGSSSALSINSQGWVVGTTMAPSGKGMLHGFLWTPTGGMKDFTTLAGFAPTLQISAAQINDLGVIALATQKGGYILFPKVTAALTSSANPSTSNHAVTLTARLTSIAGPPPDGETVKFMMAGSVLGTATISGGVAQLTTSAITAGSHPIIVNYAGDASHVAVKSNTLTQVVN